MSYICKTCRHLYVGGSKCPVCNYPNEETHERLSTSAKRQDNWDKSGSEEIGKTDKTVVPKEE